MRLTGRERALRALQFLPVDRVALMGGEIESSYKLRELSGQDYWKATSQVDVIIEACHSGSFRSMTTLRLLRLNCVNMELSSPLKGGPIIRDESPRGASTLITSAPRSPRIIVHIGPEMPVAKSITRKPAHGPTEGALSAMSMPKHYHAGRRAEKSPWPCEGIA